MRVIAFSWVWNTGKTSAMSTIQEAIRFKNTNARVMILPETAMEYIMKVGLQNVDRDAMQAYISEKEKNRLLDLKKWKDEDAYDYVIVDRTYMDGIVYTYWNILLWYPVNMNVYINDNEYRALSKEVYDHIVFFSQPIIPDLLFQDYNSEHFVSIFSETIRHMYGNKVFALENNVAFANNIQWYMDELLL